MVFLRARPEEEHHEFLLCKGRNAEQDTLLLQQVSFRCDRPPEELLREIAESVRQHGESGVVDMSVLQKQNISAN